MATVSRGKRQGGRPVTVETLTPFGRALDPILRRLGWTTYTIQEKTGINQNTVWRWMKTAKKWPPGDKVAVIEAAVRQAIPMPGTSRKR